MKLTNRICPKCGSVGVDIELTAPMCECPACGFEDWVCAFKKVDDGYLMRRFITTCGIRRKAEYDKRDA